MVPSLSFTFELSIPGTLSMEPGIETVYPLGKISVVKWKRTSARPLIRPARLISSTTPCTYVPGGITISLFIVTGKVLCRYTPSPTRALFVVIACLSAKGTLVPAGMVMVSVSFAATVVGAGAAGGCASKTGAESRQRSESAGIRMAALLGCNQGVEDDAIGKNFNHAINFVIGGIQTAQG